MAQDKESQKESKGKDKESAKESKGKDEDKEKKDKHHHHHKHSKKHSATGADPKDADADKQKAKEELTKEQMKLLEKTIKKPKNEPPNFSKNIHRAFRPYRWMLFLFGRFPIHSKVKADGTYAYSSSYVSFQGLYFIFSTAVIIAVLLTGTSSMLVLRLRDTNDTSSNSGAPGVPKPTDTVLYWGKIEMTIKQREIMHLRESALFKRHLVPFIVIWTALLLTLIGSINLFRKRTYLVNFLNFWSRAVFTMHMDVAKGLHKYCLITCIIYLLSVGALAAFGVFRFGPTSTGAPTLMALLMFKFWKPDLLAPPEYANLDEVPELAYYQMLCGILLTYIYIASRAFIFMFLFQCKLLQNAFAAWNGRVYAAVLRGGEYTQTLEGRTTYSLLFKDHCILLDLLEGTDQFFTSIIESYFGPQVASICLELFFLLRVSKEGDKQQNAFTAGFFMRERDWAPALVIVMQSVTLLWVVSKAAAAVGEEAIAGLEVIRRKTMLGRKTDEELYFTLSMYSSYTAHKKLEICGGGYFYLNKEFIIGVVSTIFSYFIIIYQFNPPLDLELPGKGVDDENLAKRVAVGRFLTEIGEDMAPCHWQETGSTSPGYKC